MDNEPSPPRRPRWLPLTVLGAGTLLVAAPLVYLWRVGKPQRLSLRAAAAPPRRVGPSALSSSASAASAAGTARFPLPAPEFPAGAPPPPPVSAADWDDADADWGVPPPPPDPNDNFNAALYTFKAFGAATLIVSSLALAGILGLRAYFDTDNAADFGAKMRREIMLRMPLLAQRMRSALGPPADDTPSPSPSQSQPEPWKADEAEARLGAAYDAGGLGAWADAAAREVEAEARLEVQAREHLKKYGPPRSKST
ncbi:hypothetical protein B0H17DRAFT_191422 [Mycena rosella]|uniref:Uncharacterized protein n=1 Tax=Mycena rosella TaxID=1033263 RepID=A0AAD7CZR9_MYCRO|nr:hypothetical protein B0H17DRAFT_191422 [Mycena rosella]